MLDLGEVAQGLGEAICADRELVFHAQGLHLDLFLKERTDDQQACASLFGQLDTIDEARDRTCCDDDGGIEFDAHIGGCSSLPSYLRGNEPGTLLAWPKRLYSNSDSYPPV